MSIQLLKMLLVLHEETPWEALKYLTGEVLYGGVTPHATYPIILHSWPCTICYITPICHYLLYHTHQSLFVISHPPGVNPAAQDAASPTWRDPLGGSQVPDGGGGVWGACHWLLGPAMSAQHPQHFLLPRGPQARVLLLTRQGNNLLFCMASS